MSGAKKRFLVHFLSQFRSCAKLTVARDSKRAAIVSGLILFPCEIFISTVSTFSDLVSLRNIHFICFFLFQALVLFDSGISDRCCISFYLIRFNIRSWTIFLLQVFSLLYWIVFYLIWFDFTFDSGHFFTSRFLCLD